MIDKHQFENRREKLRSLMRKAGLAALLISLDANRWYLSGFELHDAQINESSGRVLIFPDGNDILCTDSRFLGTAERLWDEERIFIYRGNAMPQVNELLRDKLGPVRGPVGFEARNISLEDYEAVARDLHMQRADGMVESLRMIKEPEEITRLTEACRLNHQLMQWVPSVLVPGRTEAQIAWDIEQFFRNHGAEELAFPSIVAINGNAALPHAVPGDEALTDSCRVLIDVGCRLRTYCSDQTRTFWVGDTPPAEFLRDVELVQQAQTIGIEAVRPGIRVSQVYAAAKKFLDAEGVGDLFTHGLGHGIGLQTHEAPNLGASMDTELRPGMVITVEPGIYRPGRGGVRWEYMVLVTEDGAHIL